MGYTHLTVDDRYTIYEGHVNKLTVTEIAMQLGRSKATVSRELRRNRGGRGYRPKQATELAAARAQNCANGPRVSPELLRKALRRLRQDQWSPEQIAGRFKRDGTGQISHESIYEHIRVDKAAGGTLYRHLRNRKLRRKRYGSGVSGRGQIPDRTGIEERPAVVAAKSRVGDWEADTVVGAGHAQAIVTVVERKTRYTVLHKVARNTTALVTEGIVAQLSHLTPLVKTITFDNGREFSAHMSVASALGAKTYFANPYCSWERGLNENTNGLLRQYHPKGSVFKNITQSDLDGDARKLNNRPRKTLNYETPTEALAKAAARAGVALQI
jgi:IS30 family transposase